MKEIVEFRINADYAHLLFSSSEGKNLGTSVKIVELSKEDSRYAQIPIIAKEVKEKYGRGFYFGWQIKRKYNKNEIEHGTLFQIKIKTVFEPTGEECGTLYDESVACEICGSNRKQISPLNLKKGSIPKKDIAKTIAGEVVVSQKFADVLNLRKIKGIVLEPIYINNGVSDYFQLSASSFINLSNKTIVGVDPFDFSTESRANEFALTGGYKVEFEKEIYKCPKGHTIGLNLLSEVFVIDSTEIYDNDFSVSKQKTGVKRGFLRPEPIYFCSQAFRKIVEEEKLSGIEFELAYIDIQNSE